MFAVHIDGTGLTPLTPPGQVGLFDEDGGSWSPDGTQIIFGARTDNDHRRSVWSVHPDGSGLHQMSIAGCGGLFADPASGGCADPSWSPDGQQIVVDRVDGRTGERNIYTMNADGTDLTQVTHGGNVDEDPDWGTHLASPD